MGVVCEKIYLNKLVSSFYTKFGLPNKQRVCVRCLKLNNISASFLPDTPLRIEPKCSLPHWLIQTSPNFVYS